MAKGSGWNKEGLRRRLWHKVHCTKKIQIDKYNLAVLITEKCYTLDVKKEHVKYNHFKSGQKNDSALALIFNFWGDLFQNNYACSKNIIEA